MIFGCLQRWQTHPMDPSSFVLNSFVCHWLCWLLDVPHTSVEGAHWVPADRLLDSWTLINKQSYF
jgi:hypothetical protein